MTGIRSWRSCAESQQPRIPVCDGELDNIVGMLHMKLVARELSRGPLDRDMLIELARARSLFRSRRHASQYSAAEFPASETPHRSGRR